MPELAITVAAVLAAIIGFAAGYFTGHAKGWRDANRPVSNPFLSFPDHPIYPAGGTTGVGVGPRVSSLIMDGYRPPTDDWCPETVTHQHEYVERYRMGVETARATCLLCGHEQTEK